MEAGWFSSWFLSGRFGTLARGRRSQSPGAQRLKRHFHVARRWSGPGACPHPPQVRARAGCWQEWGRLVGPGPLMAVPRSCRRPHPEHGIRVREAWRWHV